MNVDFSKKFEFLCPICHKPINESSINFIYTNKAPNISYNCKYNSAHNNNMDLLNYFETIYPLQNLYKEPVICNKHNKPFTSYCTICGKDLCPDCVYSDEEKSHRDSIIDYYKNEYTYNYSKEISKFIED